MRAPAQVGEIFRQMAMQAVIDSLSTEQRIAMMGLGIFLSEHPNATHIELKKTSDGWEIQNGRDGKVS
jgi:hypothetical protein